jgi:hypothetical protein
MKHTYTSPADAATSGGCNAVQPSATHKTASPDGPGRCSTLQRCAALKNEFRPTPRRQPWPMQHFAAICSTQKRIPTNPPLSPADDAALCSDLQHSKNEISDPDPHASHSPQTLTNPMGRFGTTWNVLAANPRPALRLRRRDSRWRAEDPDLPDGVLPSAEALCPRQQSATEHRSSGERPGPHPQRPVDVAVRRVLESALPPPHRDVRRAAQGLVSRRAR